MTRSIADAISNIVLFALIATVLTLIYLCYTSPETLVAIKCDLVTDSNFDKTVCYYANRPAR